MAAFLSKIRKPNRTKRLLKKIRSFFYVEQWILLLGKNVPETNPSWDHFTRIIPPADRVWADPFIWVHNDCHYVFYEEQPFDTKRGRICCMAIDDDLNIIENQTVLEQPYHLSYPFLFQYEGDLYMLPETGENHTIEIYQCLRFPDKWEKVKNLMSGVRAVDATLFEANGRWWLFANIAENGASTWDTLYLFYSDHPLSENWMHHPKNPIIRDLKSARPAGKIFSSPMGLIRPSQDCSIRYGYAINFNRINQISETEYTETQLWKFQPETENIIATHTWNKAGNICAIDAKILRPKY